MSSNTKGITAAIIAAVAYGLNPFFALPLYKEGLSVDSVIFYRYIFSILMLGAIMLFKRESFAIKPKEVLTLISLGMLFALSSIMLFDSFNYMDAGIACTILFVYPVIVAIAMGLFFKERLSPLAYGAIILALTGIMMLYDGGEKTLSLTGVLLVVISSLAYSAYIIVVNKSVVKDMNAIKLTFWAIIFGSLVVVVRLNMLSDLQPLENTTMWMNALGIALIPTVISMVFIAIAINKIGSTYTSILGSLEPLTALTIGIIVFNEPITTRITWGVILIIVAVTLVVAGNPLMNIVKRKRIKQNGE